METIQGALLTDASVRKLVWRQRGELTVRLLLKIMP